MLRLEPIIARFVDQVLGAIRAASIDDLRDLLPLAAAEKPQARPERVARVPAPSRERPTPSARAAVVRGAAPARKARRQAPPRGAANDLTEITDPEKLLRLVLAAPSATGFAGPAREVAILADEPPASTERPTAGAKGRLRAGETVARETGGGVVIRRAKKP